MAQHGFAVVAFRDGELWQVEALPPAMLNDLGVLLQALRSQPPDGGPFVIATVDDEFFLIARQDGPRISLLLSDLTASVEYPLAAQVLTRLGEDPPDEEGADTDGQDLRLRRARHRPRPGGCRRAGGDRDHPVASRELGR